jgi:putative transposase
VPTVLCPLRGGVVKRLDSGGFFINYWMKEKYYKVKSHGEIPESRVLAPSADKIKEAVCSAYGVKGEDLTGTRRRIANEPRNIAIYLGRHYSGRHLKVLVESLIRIHIYSVGRVIERMRMQILKDKRLKKRIAELEKKLIMSQEQI